MTDRVISPARLFAAVVVGLALFAPFGVALAGLSGIGHRWIDILAQFTVVNVLDNQYRKDNSFTAFPFYQPFIGADPLGRRFNLSVQYKF